MKPFEEWIMNECPVKTNPYTVFINAVCITNTSYNLYDWIENSRCKCKDELWKVYGYYV